MFGINSNVRKEVKVRDVFNNMKKSLDDSGYNYQVDQERMVIRTGFQGDDLPIPVVMYVDDEHPFITVATQLDIEVPETSFGKALELINELNSGIRFGLFVLDCDNRMINFRYNERIVDETNKIDHYKELLALVVTTTDRYDGELKQKLEKKGVVPNNMYG